MFYCKNCQSQAELARNSGLFQGLPGYFNDLQHNYITPSSTIRKMMKAIAKVTALLIAAWLISIGWWNLWMNHGFIGCPGIIARVLHADGENAYNANQVEMFVIATFTLILVFTTMRKKTQLSSTGMQ
jgi:hypothetical protein